MHFSLNLQTADAVVFLKVLLWNGLKRQLLQTSPRYGYLIVAAILLLWLLGIICGWKWTYTRPGSWGGSFWLETLGPKAFRFWLGVILAVGIGLALFLFSISGK